MSVRVPPTAMEITLACKAADSHAPHSFHPTPATTENKIENGITCFNNYCIEGKRHIPGGVVDIPLTVFY